MMSDVVVSLGIVCAGVLKAGEDVIVSTANRDLQVPENKGIRLPGDVFVATEPFQFLCEIDGEFSIAGHAAEAGFPRFQAPTGTSVYVLERHGLF